MEALGQKLVDVVGDGCRFNHLLDAPEHPVP
jgi:hypothetical protein